MDYTAHYNSPIGGITLGSDGKALIGLWFDGQTVTYGQLSQTLGCKSAQAVGGAVGHNPLTLIVPCHRVVGTGGSLTGYAGGIDKKVRLLQMEGAMIHDLFIPTRGTAL